MLRLGWHYKGTDRVTMCYVVITMLRFITIKIRTITTLPGHQCLMIIATNCNHAQNPGDVGYL